MSVRFGSMRFLSLSSEFRKRKMGGTGAGRESGEKGEGTYIAVKQMELSPLWVTLRHTVSEYALICLLRIIVVAVWWAVAGRIVDIWPYGPVTTLADR